MLRRWIAVVLGCLAFWCAEGVCAQVRDTSITVNFYGVDEGLPSPDVSSIYRDSFGFIWIGTAGGGLSYFDAMSFHNYYPNARISDSLADGDIVGITEDQAHNLVIATQGGVSYYDRSAMRFQNYDIDYQTLDSTQYSGVLAIYVDRKDQCWVLTYRGLGNIDPRNGNIYYYDFPYPLGPEPDYPNAQIKEDREGNLWLLVSARLFSFNPITGNYASLSQSSYEVGTKVPDRVTGFAFDKQNRLCVSSPSKIYVYRDAINLPFVYPAPFLTPSNPVTIEAFWLDGDDQWWVLSRGQLYFIEEGGAVWQRYKHIYTTTEKLGMVANAGMEFNHSHLFFFPIDGGFAVWDLKPSFFTQTMSRLNCRSKLHNKSVTAIYTREDKGVWIGTSNGEILHFDRGTDTVVSFTDLQANLFREHRSHVNAFYRFSSGELVAGTSEGLLYLDPQQDLWTRRFPSPWLWNLAGFLDGKNINKIALVDAHHLGFALADGFILFDLRRGELNEYTALRGLNIREFVAEEPNKLLCVGNESLYRLDLELDKSERLYFATEYQGAFLNIEAICLAHGTDRSVWVGTDQGLFCLQHGQIGCVRVSEHYFFKSNPVNALVCDRQGNVWIATQRGMAEYDPTAAQLFVFGKNDGLVHKGFKRNISFVSPQDQIYFGCQNGLTYFRPHARESAEIGQVLASRIVLLGLHNVFEVSSLLSHDVVMSEEIPAANFHLTLLNFANRSQVYFQIMLEGLYERWTDLESRNVVNLSRLPAGEYIFRYRASLNREVWSEGSPYRVHVLQKFSLKDFIWGYLPFITLILLVLTVFFARNYVLDTHGKVNERIKMAMHLEALNQDLRQKNRVIEIELRNARHSQDVILPPLSLIRERCPNSFVMFKPLREVSGDIYWYSTYEHYIYMGVIDCTGHGISAAIMSLITYVFLHDIIIVQHVTSASRILASLSNALYERNKHIDNMETMSEGADVSFCVIDTQRQMINFAGAFHRIVHCRAGVAEVYTGDPAFVGSEVNLNFTSRMIHYRPSDELFLFSDGYSDQIGGDYAKKMRFARFQELLVDASLLPIGKQEAFLQQELLAWQGANAQYDDITVMGLIL